MDINQQEYGIEYGYRTAREWGNPLGWFTGLCFFSWLSASADRAVLQGAALTLAGIVMIFHPARKRITATIWIAAAFWLIGCLLAFLPVTLIDPPAWRNTLSAVGIHTGGQITPQPAEAFASTCMTIAMATVALWAFHQISPRGKSLYIGIAMAIAIYALVAVFHPMAMPQQPTGDRSFGFFPNRNHTATLLVMGCMISLGLAIQGIRQKNRFEICSGAAILIFLLGILIRINVSRAGIVLLALGFLIWILVVSPSYLRGNAARATALLTGGAIMFFAVVDTPVKRRITATTQDLFQENFIGSVSAEKSSATEGRESRLALLRDAMALIADAPLTGWGAEQFRYLFPQYQNHTLSLTYKNCLHPESDWLWIAVERGIPAAASLLLIGLTAVLRSVKSIRNGRARARRAGLLAAALVLPIHGLFDVPGHHFSLLWLSALLMGLAEGHGMTAGDARPSTTGWRITGLVVMGFGALVLRGEWTGDSLLPSVRANQLFDDALELYRQEHDQPSIAGGPEGEQDLQIPDRLETALEKLDQASSLTPLDHRLWGLKGMIDLHFDDKDDLARQHLATQRALEPAWIDLPLSHAEAWSKISSVETVGLWKEAIRRADQMDRKFVGSHSRERIMNSILNTCANQPALHAAALELTIEVPEPSIKASEPPVRDNANLAPLKQ